MPFGQLVIGSPGSGKTTYCHGLYQFLHALNRPISIVNLDPANGLSLPYPCAINIASLITVKDVMKELGLGPNGAMLYCMEYLEENLSWLEGQLDELSDDAYVAFDLPGQVELSTNHGSLRRILDRLAKRDWRLVAVHLMDASHITDASRYVSLLLLSLRAMLTLELPHVNVLSKVDLLGEAAETKGSDEGSNLSDDDEDDPEVRKKAGGLAFNLDYYTEVQDLSFLMDHLRSSQGPRRSSRFSELNERICELVEDFGLVSFETLAVEDKRSMLRLQLVLDKATGYVYVEKREGQGGEGSSSVRQGPLPSEDDAAHNSPPGDATKRGTAASAGALFTVADRGAPLGWGSAADVQERWVDHRDDWRDFEIKERKELHERWKGDSQEMDEGGGGGGASAGEAAAAMGSVRKRGA